MARAGPWIAGGCLGLLVALVLVLLAPKDEFLPPGFVFAYFLAVGSVVALGAGILLRLGYRLRRDRARVPIFLALAWLGSLVLGQVAAVVTMARGPAAGGGLILAADLLTGLLLFATLASLAWAIERPQGPAEFSVVK